MATKKQQHEDEDEFEFDFEGDDEDDADDKVKIEEKDDTPEDDKGRSAMPKEIVDEVDGDEFEEYSDKVKSRMKQMKKIYHDERREKERVVRENNEAISATQRLLEENRRLKTTLSQGEKSLISSYKQAAEGDIALARKEYRDAYEAGDTDKVLEANEKLSHATYRLNQIAGYTPTLQEEPEQVENFQPPRPDATSLAWQERNKWYGSDTEMTATALGLHQKLVTERGAQFAGSDEYWRTVDKTMRRRFPEYFEDDDDTPAPRQKTTTTTVVAPASRSRAPKRIMLSKSQVALARKLGLTNEQYAKELVKLESE